jgi:hypothetical protein
MDAVERPALRTDTRITTNVYRRPVDQEVERRTASVPVSRILAKLEWLGRGEAAAITCPRMVGVTSTTRAARLE